jgi:hypothetical protein
MLTSLDQPLLVLATLFTLFTKRATLMRRSTVLSHPLARLHYCENHAKLASFKEHNFLHFKTRKLSKFPIS